MAHNRNVIISLLIAAILIVVSNAQLTSDFKQYLLNEHNSLRRLQSAPNMRLMEWNGPLASIAETAASTCSDQPTDKSILLSAVGNKFSWVGERRQVLPTATGLTKDSLTEIFRCWSDPSSSCHDASVLPQLIFPDTYLLGCGAKYYSSADKCHTIPNGLVLVCFYGPGSVVSSAVDTVSGEPCMSCPKDAPHCVTELCYSQTEASPVPPDVPVVDPMSPTPNVYYITPNRGSFAGGTLVTLVGTGFSSDQFNRDNPDLGNVVTFTRGDHVIPCHVEKYYTSTTRIVCRTSAIPQRSNSNYQVTVTVDGKSIRDLGGRMCGGNSCPFYYRSWATPTITSVTPHAGIPSEMPMNISLNGRVFSYRVTDTQEIDDDFLYGQTVDRMIVGGEVCDPWLEDNDDTYGGVLTNGNGYGSVSCRPDATRIDSMNATIFLSAYGRSQTAVNDYSVDNKLRQYLYQTHSDITRVEPNSGSPNGGTLITIYGKHLYDPAGDVKAYISGVPCRVVNYTSDMIQCVTGSAPSESTVYPGARGVVREVWLEHDSLDILETKPYGYPNTSYMWAIQERAYRDKTFPSEFGERNYFNQRYSGFFVPPLDSYYTFNLISDDPGRLYLSPNTSREHKELIAQVQYWSNTWDRYESQLSSPIYLEAGQSYYIEAVNRQGTGGWNIGFGAKLHNLSWTSDTALADHEVQSVEITSAVIESVQEIAIKCTPKIQVITLSLTSVEELLYQLSFGDNVTNILTEDDTESTITSSLNELHSVKMMGSVSVKINKSDSDVIELTIIYISEMDPMQDIMVLNHTDYTSQIIQTYSKPSDFTLRFDPTRQTDPISITETAANVTAKIMDLFTTKCQLSGAGDIFFKDSYDVVVQTGTSGFYDNTREPYCGRYSNKNPVYIFRTNNLRDERTNTPHQEVTLTAFGYRYVCFAYYGVIPHSIIRVYIRGNATVSNTWVNIQFDASITDQWTYKCINVYQELQNRRNDPTRSYRMVHLAFYGGTADYWIDELTISTSESTVTRTMQAVRPNGIFINSVSVQRNDTSPKLTCHDDTDATSCDIISSRYIISFNTYFCRNDVPLMSSPSPSICVTQLIQGSPAIGGTFDLTFENRTIFNISATAEESEVTELLTKYLPSEGSFSVTREGDCAGYSWSIKWNERGGDLPLMVADGSKLVGDMVEVSVSTVIDGGVWLRPFRGDMLRLPELTPQVQVMVNGIPASCRGRNCSFTFTEDSTPTVTSINPPMGGQDGSPIHIYGRNFVSDTSKLTVSIANQTCEVISSNETVIQCVPSPHTAGYYKASIHIDGVGYSIPSQPGSDIFQYSLMLHSISPDMGSLFGGNRVTLTGVGFPVTMDGHMPYSSHHFKVLFDDYPCFIMSSNLTTLTCKVQPHAPSTVNVTVMVNGLEDSIEDGYEYSISSTAVITSINPLYATSGGGTLVSIVGRNFNTTDVSVEIGPSICNITSISYALITCTTAMIAPGTYPLIVTSEGFGSALHKSWLNQIDNITQFTMSTSEMRDYGMMKTLPYPQFDIIFRVSDVSPCNGSLAGGTELTIQGMGFTPDTLVSVGEKGCNITSVSSSMIKCVTPSSRGHRVIDNSGIHTVLGQYFSWTPDYIEIEVGDTVEWQWDGSKFSTPRAFEVHQSMSLTTSQMVVGGFQSSSSVVGNFKHIFTQSGTYFYSSSVDDLCQACVMSGTIIVKPLRDITADIKVTLGHFEAIYTKSSSESNPTNATDDCESCERTNGLRGPDSRPAFLYSKCSTPMVSSIDFSIPYITINGAGFGDNPNNVQLNFGDHSCSYYPSVTSNEIVCHFHLTSNVQPLVPLPLVLHVDNSGYALLTSPQLANRSITIIPTVYSVQPKEGSVLGGNVVSLVGTALKADNVSVMFGTQECPIVSIAFDTIKCTAPRATVTSDDSVVNITVMYGTVEAKYDKRQYNYTLAKTPSISNISPLAVGGVDPTNITIIGALLEGDVDITIGPYSCDNVSDIDEHQYICSIEPIQAGDYPVTVLVHNYGYAVIESGVDHTITSTLRLDDVTPNDGSIRGGTTITISGIGFSRYHSNNTVTVGDQACTIVGSEYTSISCITPDLGSEGNYTVVIAVTPGLDRRRRDNPEGLPTFAYDINFTPQVHSVSPTSGQKGDVVTITGSLFSDDASIMSVTIGSSPCSITFTNETVLMCILGSNYVGEYDINVIIDGLGRADGNVKFNYTLRVTGSSPAVGSYAGMNLLTISGIGFNPLATFITICDVMCPPSTNEPSLTSIQCVLPSFAHLTSQGNTRCNVTVSSLSTSVTLIEAYILDLMVTPHITAISRDRGGTAGGSTIQLTGSNLGGDNVTVTIAGVICSVESQSNTEITCITRPSGRTIKSLVMVYIAGKGFAINEGVEFFYVDVWSSIYTWGGTSLPQEGDFVIVPRGQTLVLDTRTPVLKILLIQGGQLIFDDEKDGVELHSENILITDGGLLQVGTEDMPYQHKAKIVMYGNVLSTEIPLFGAKTLAVRNGTLDLHGKPIANTWTRLSQTARAGDTELHLMHNASDWGVGSQIVIATTSYSRRENEELTIASISQDGMTLSLTTPLQYTHISLSQTISGRVIETRAEVGLLTRNVVVRGNRNSEWDRSVENCEDDFNPGQFALQTCFEGRFGSETIGDQFGSQIMLHRGPNDKVVGRIEYVEVTHAGQAFRLGRYPIHFHLNGDVNGSYVRGCGIHHTFNRACTVHGVDNLLVEKNVAFNILGHAYFLEDGIEQHNIIQYNLGIYVRASSSLLNVDITPAVYWVVNPSNIIRHNAAAGGTHFGFWYRLPQFPTGPSATTSIRPFNLPLTQFTNNSAHSFGWYGIWIFPSYHPVRPDICNEVQPAVFENFIGWRNDRGVEFSEIGAVQLKNSIFLDNIVAGVEYTEVTSAWGDEGALIDNILVVGHSALRDEDGHGSDICTAAGVKTPHTNFFTVSNVTFVNFDESGCYALQACSHCRKDLQGGFESRFKGLSFENSPNTAVWKWKHEHVFRDMDGSLTGTPGGSLIPSSNLYPSDHCSHHPSSSTGAANGTVCDQTVAFTRIGIANPVPSSLTFRDLRITNDHGTDQVIYIPKRFVLSNGYMAIIPTGKVHQLDWLNGERFTNISYDSIYSGLTSNDYLWIRHDFNKSVDVISVDDQKKNSSSSIPPSGTSLLGDYFVNKNETSVTYYVNGSDPSCPIAETISFTSYQCFYENCIPPPPPEPPTPRPPGRPAVTQMWSNASIWPDGQLPGPNADVHIDENLYVLVDVPLPSMGVLTVAGGLEFLDTMDHFLQADRVLIDGGQMVAGTSQTPFQHKLTILLNGDLSSPEYRLPNLGPVLGAKGLGVFGELEFYSDIRGPAWTMLTQTATSGSNEITLSQPVDWVIGDEIVISSTSFESLEAEQMTITGVSSDKLTLTLNKPLTYNHLGLNSNSYGLGAEVGMLTRNIKIIGTHPNATTDTAQLQSFGCRVLISNYVTDDNTIRTGIAKIHGVEFKGCGQEGFVEDFDPRYSLAYVNVGDIVDNSSYVTSCSFHGGYNTGIGAFGTNSLVLTDNVIHRSVGPSVQVTGSGHRIVRNLAVVSLFPGTYRIPEEPDNSEWTANFDLARARDIELIGNAAAGGGKSGFHSDGEDCQGEGFVPKWKDNVAHSTLHGIHVAYSDGHHSNGRRDGCSAFNRFKVYSCYHYGFFSYSGAGIRIMSSIFINNYAATFTIVVGPPSLSHVVSFKNVRIEDTVIKSTFDSVNCTEYSRKPTIANHKTSHSGIQSTTRAHVGVILSSFTSGNGHFPEAAWWSIITYPAINGHTNLSNVTFINFGTHCTDRREAVIITHPGSEDCQHPLIADRITLTNISSNSLFYNHPPKLGSINPSDCVDMDCDGLKKILIRDMDGSLTGGNTMSTIISRSEFEWNGDRRRGLGDYRIPRTMLATPTGSMIPVDTIYPNKGIYRGTGNECQFETNWNSYLCRGIDHMMLVIESLDIDTEVRRLSPIGLGADEYIDLINGPQDHGWCGGYTCQERISTFYTLVSTGLNYVIGLTSTNPQRTNLMLLNAMETQSLSVAIIYTNPQRLDVYVGSNYIIPTNGYYGDDGNLRYSRHGNFSPVIGQAHGTNYYNRNEKKLYIIIRGGEPVRVEITSVIQLGIDLPPVTVDEFFETNLINNLALLLNIPANRIRIVNVVSEASRKRQAATTRVEIEIGDAPANSTTDGTTAVPVNATDPYYNATTDSSSGNSSVMYSELVNITTRVAEVIQTGELSEGIGLMVVNADVTEPLPPVVDPTGGVRATNGTGGPQPGDQSAANLTTYSERQLEEEEEKQNETAPITLSIPSSLNIQHIPLQSIEGLPTPSSIKVAMLDGQRNIVKNLGIGRPWELTVTVSQSHAVLTNSIALMENGFASFDNLTVSHPGIYTFHFRVTYPTNANFNITSSSTMTVTRRHLDMVVVRQPIALTNTTFPVPHSLVIHIVDRVSGQLTNTGWRGRQWYMTASLVPSNGVTFRTIVTDGIATFNDIYITNAGSYKFRFEVSTQPQSVSEDLPSLVDSDTFEVVQYQLSRYIVIYNNSYNDTIKNHETRFIQEIKSTINSIHPNIIIYNATVSEGSIILTFFATSNDVNSLLLFNRQVTTSDLLSVSFRGTQLSLSSVTQDPAYPITAPPTQDTNTRYVVVIVVCVGLALGIIVGVVVITLVMVSCYCIKKKFSDKRVKPKTDHMYELQRTSTIYTNAPLFVDEDCPTYHLVSEDGEKVGVVDDKVGVVYEDIDEKRGMTNGQEHVNYAEVKVKKMTSKSSLIEKLESTSADVNVYTIM